LEVSAKDGTNINLIFEDVAAILAPGMTPNMADKTISEINLDDDFGAKAIK
jgi:hypothetical protein